jgi:hypothetical protein
LKRAPDFLPWRSLPILKAPDPRLRAISAPGKMIEWPLLNGLPGRLLALGMRPEHVRTSAVTFTV